jgi:1,4-dihydroxy-2-naphthoate octaprenyltransferase
VEQRIETSQTTSIQRKKPFRWHVWWKLLRPHTLTASIIPVLIGTSLTLDIGSIHWLLFLAMLLASILIQTATNMFNEYYDFKRGLDTKESVGIGGAIVREGIHPNVVFNLAILCCVIAICLGVYICMNSSWWVAVIGSISMAVGYLYTGGPYPIAYTPYGELVSGLFMGPNIILLSFYIQTGTITEYSILVSVPITILVAAIMLANNIRDLDGDKAAGRRTLAILLGRQKAIYLLTVMFILTYMWTLVLVITTSSPWLLLVFLSAPTAIKAVRGFLAHTNPSGMMPAMRSTAQLHMRYGLLLSIALFL